MSRQNSHYEPPSIGSFGPSGTSLTPPVTITNTDPAVVPLTIKGAAAQSANLQEWQASSGTTLSRITGSGAFISTSNISTIGGALINSGAAGSAKDLQLQTAGAARWIVRSNSAAEGGANAGSNFEINRYDDSGTLLGAALSIVRSTGHATFSGNVVAGAVVQATNSAIVTGAAATTRLLAFQTAGLNRWILQANSTAEGGANAGTDLELKRYDDSGALLSTIVSIVRSSGLLSINGTVSLADATNIVLGSATGSKIGTGGGQKLGFYNATPIVQAAAIGAPTAPSAVYVQAEAQSMKTAVDAIRTALSAALGGIGITA